MDPNPPLRPRVDPAHLGPDEQAWADSPVAGLAALRLPTVTRAVVLAPHPDDEVLGAGGLMQVLTGVGIPVEVCAVTDGERSWGPLAASETARLRRMRTAESDEALGRLGVRGARHRLRLPDGDVAGYLAVVADWLGARLSIDTLCVAPWVGDGHPDHDAVGRAALAASVAVGSPLLGYLVWAWHWADPTGTDLPWDACRRLELTSHQSGRKRWATEAFASQISVPLAAQHGLPVLPAEVLARFHRPFEVYVV